MSETSDTVVAERLIGFVRAEILADPDATLEVDTDLLLTGLVDSLGVVRIVAEIEAAFGLAVQPEDVTLENFQTIAAMVAYINRRSCEN